VTAQDLAKKDKKKTSFVFKACRRLAGQDLQRIHVRRYFFCELHFVPFGQADRDLAKMQFRLEIDTATATQE